MARAHRRRAQRRTGRLPGDAVVTIAIPVPPDLQTWERELLLPYVQDLLEGMLIDGLDGDESDEDS